MASNQIPSHNPEGYADPTAHDALEPVQREQLEADHRLARLIKTLKNTIDLAGYDLLNRIELRDRSNGRIYR